MTIFIVPSDDTPTINSAIDQAESGDIIKIKEGTYSENVIVDKNFITIQALDRASVTIRGFNQTGIGIDIKGVEGVIIQDLVITNYSIAIFLRGNKNRIIDVSATSNAIYGCLLRGDNNIIEDCLFRLNVITGVNIAGSSNICRNNICDENVIGGFICSEGSAIRNLIENNTIFESEIAIGWLTINSTNNVFSKNLIANNDFAIIIQNSGNEISRNIIKSHKLEGVDILGDDNKLLNNLVVDSNVGLTIVGNKTEVIGNVFLWNKSADIVNLGEGTIFNSNKIEKEIL
ncbi:NosD domain-containing protein [Bacillus sp. SCS-151]|uniref:NosD domain-containing protein n=1 Tax=Nanhaiella sioensis TaxID=3115293 RepID=UPI00397CAB69